MATKKFSFPQMSLPTGVTPIPQTSLGVSVKSVTLSLARCTTATPTIWPSAATTLVIALEVSYDGGVMAFPSSSGSIPITLESG